MEAEMRDPQGIAGVVGDHEKAPHEEGKRHAAPINVLTVYFPTGQSTLDVDARRSIDALTTSMSVRRVQIAARTDSTGTPAQNSRLVYLRAVAVARYLKTMPHLTGVPIDTEAKALCCYVATNGDANGRRLNRRVDIALIPAEPEGAP
jgi:outer membrane protein OmpA-like peptidoglycan-associated protein